MISFVILAVTNNNAQDAPAQQTPNPLVVQTRSCLLFKLLPYLAVAISERLVCKRHASAAAEKAPSQRTMTRRTRPSGLLLLCAAAALLPSAARAAAAPASCTPPRAPADALKPFCVVPSTVSKEAQAVLSTMAVLKSDVSTPTRAQEVRCLHCGAELQDERNQVGGLAARRVEPSSGPAAATHTLAPARPLGTPSPSSTPPRPHQNQPRRQVRAAFAATSAAGTAGLEKGYIRAAQNETISGVPTTLWTPVYFKPGVTAGKVIFYLHGGGHSVGSCASMWNTAMGVARDAGVKVLCADYRLAPEHPFPAGLDDAVKVYRALLTRNGPRNIALLGDSSGGGLALALLLKAKQLGLQYPAAVVLFSPWSELQKTGDTQTTLSGIDPKLQYEEKLRSAALAYVGGDASKLSDPLVSPLRANWSKAAVGTLPPVLIQAGLRDVLLSDAARLYRELRAAGQPVEFSPWEGARAGLSVSGGGRCGMGG